MNQEFKAHCTKCGNTILGNEDALCGNCSGEGEDFDRDNDGNPLVIELEPICGKPENHNNGDDTCAECIAIENNI